MLRLLLQAELLVLLILAALSLPALLPDTEERLEVEARGNVGSFHAWLADRPACHWRDADDATGQHAGTLTCVQRQGVFDFGAPPITAMLQGFPGELGDDFILDSRTLEPSSTSPSWPLRLLTLGLLCVATAFALRLSGWKWADEAAALSRRAAWAWPAAIVAAQATLQALWPAGDAAHSFAEPTGLGLPPDKGMAIALAVLWGPIAEEAVFRQFLYRGLIVRVALPTVAALTTALFVLPHLPQILAPGDLGTSLAVASGYVVAGLLFFVVRWRTGALLPAILCHAGLNALVLIR